MRGLLPLLVIAAILAVNASAHPQTPKPPTPPPAAPRPAEVVTPKQPYDSARAQLAFEQQKNAQLEAQQLEQARQKAMENLQQQYAKASQDLQVWETEVRKANGWDATYTYDPQADHWTHQPAPPVPAKAESKKK